MTVRDEKRTTRTARDRRPTARRTRRTARAAATQPLLRPEHQRELFALLLMTIAVITIIFFVTGDAGGIGSAYLGIVRRLFGAGALIVPLTLGLVGIAILIQERMRDSQFSPTNVIGTVAIQAALLALLEFPAHLQPLAERSGSGGGGWFGYWFVSGLDAAISRPAAIAVALMVLLIGVLLTFDLTVTQVAGAAVRGLRSFWAVVWGAPRRSAVPVPAAAPQTGRTTKTTKLPKTAELRYEPPPAPIDSGQDDADVVKTPIAARPTRASLFQRGDVAATLGRSEPPAAEPAKAAPPARKRTAPARPAGDAMLQNLLSSEPADTTRSTEVLPGAQQLDLPPLTGGDGPGELTVTNSGRSWPLPPLAMLAQRSEVGGITEDERRHKARVIEETLASFKVEARVVGVNTGPAVTQFELQPAVGVKVAKITQLERDLALALAAQSMRIEAPIPGKAVVGIEIPNSAIASVGMREVLESPEFDANKGKLKLPLGKDVSGTPVIADMTRMPHLLVAGSTGSGKSVAINAFLCGLLLKHSPDELKLILVDPKMVEMIVYNNVPHLLTPVITETERVVPTLKWATREMERRYKIFARHSCRNLDSYRTLAQRSPELNLEPMPYILIVIDELADLMMMASDDVETQICRLAQMARATGIHLIIATQRPSVDVITGLIKANFPSRIAFAVTSQVDSRVILDTYGAEQLLGRGDMLYMAADASKVARIQGTFVADREVEQIVKFWSTARPPLPEGAVPAAAETTDTPPGPSLARRHPLAAATAAAPLPPVTTRVLTDEDTTFRPPAAFLSAGDQDALLPQAIELVAKHERASASLLQRRLRIGYSKAAQLIDLLEEQGYVGPADGGRSREVLIRNEDD
jgi:S-DNA-T family DNA segregation ATPase FtsK/SpoIIIE